MSSRALRKLHGQNINLFPDLKPESDEEEDIVEKPAVVNKFALLNESGTNSDENEETSITTASAEDQKFIKLNGAKQKKRNKKKKKLPVKKPKDFEETLKEVEDIPQDKPSSSKIQASSPFKYVLQVEHRNLNPDNELKKIFGSRVLMADASYRRRNQGTQYKGVWLTQPQNNWPKPGRTGNYMESLESTQNQQIFKYSHSPDYREVQFRFLDAVESSDHRNIASVLEKHPYHIDALLTFSDVYKMHDDIRMARELIERALYCLERSFHSCFSLTTGRSRLPYKYEENRCLFLALYKHMNFVAQRGCNRTALELCKVLLTLDPEEDPLCSIFLFDYFALRAAEYEYLIRFSQEWGMKRNHSQLPNWAFSLALAHYHQSSTEEKDLKKADELLQNALIMFPSVLLPLLEKCSVQPDTKISSHNFFTKHAEETLPQGLALLCHLFVERNYTFWKNQDVLSWLERNVNSVLESLDQRTLFVRDCSDKRKLRFVKPPLNVYRHALMSELPDVGSYLPLDVRMGTLLSHDPLPPKDTVKAYDRPQRSNAPHRRRNPVSLFFQALFPDYNPDQQDYALGVLDELETEEENANAGNLGQLRGNVQALMNAMRELLLNIQEPANEEEEEFNEEWD